jgi:thioredoxin-related protein
MRRSALKTGSARRPWLWVPLLLPALLCLALLRTAVAETLVDDDGLYTQSWFLQSFLDLRQDLADTTKEGKRLAVVWEQRGCPYCKDMHTIDFADRRIAAYVRDNFEILQLNIWGDREVTDLDGQELPEKDLAKKWGILRTPTIVYLPEADKAAAGESGRRVEVARMPGYLGPVPFLAMFKYVREKRYADETFRRYLADALAQEKIGSRPDERAGGGKGR